MKHVFITGCPRSGTTMLASMLGNGDSCFATPESDFFINFIYKYLPNSFSNVRKDVFLRYLSNNYRFKQWNINAVNIDELPESIDYSNFNTVIENTIALFLKHHTETNIKEGIRIDHTPSSIKYFQTLIELFPKSKFIFIVRDPRAVYASVKGLDWGANSPLRLSEIWREYVMCYFTLQKLFPDKVHLIKYEDILKDPREKLKELCGFLQINYNDSMLDGTGFKIPDYTVSQHALVGKKPDKKRIEKWKEELNRNEVLIIESICKSIMSVFNYNVSLNVHYRIHVKDKIKTFIRESIYYIKNRINKKIREHKT